MKKKASFLFCNGNIWLFSLFTFLVLSCSKDIQKPNVLIIQADDLGYDDLSIHNNPYLETPNLDNLGELSAQFNNFYVSPVCAPTRAALLTGRNFLKTGVTSVHAGRDYMNLSETNIAEVFKVNGYTTGMWGKWHSGKTNGYFPWDRGFDEGYYACLYNYFDNNGLLNGVPHPTEGYTTDAITDMAISFITKNKDKPFFAYMSHLAPHNPWRAPEKYIEKYRNKGLSEPNSILYGMIDNLDHNVGRLLKTVEELGIEDNTIIVFLSDNGPWIRSYRFGLTEEEWKLRNPSGLKGMKGKNWENGVRSSLFIKWKGNINPIIDTEHRLKVEDIFPTMLSMCNIPLPDSLKLDGNDFSPVFKNKEIESRPIFASSYYPKVKIGGKMADQNTPQTKEFKSSMKFEDQILSIIDNNYKFVQNQEKGITELYNLNDDPSETKNLISKEKEIAEDLKNKLTNWYNEVLKGDSHNMPVFQIGYPNKDFCQIYACAPTKISSSLINSTHFLGNWGTSQDTAFYAVKVHQPGEYHVFLIHEIKDYSNLTFKLSTENSFVQAKLSDSGDRNFGVLLEGESAYWEDFDLKETFRKTIIKSDLGTIHLNDEDKFLNLSIEKADGLSDDNENNKVISIQLVKI